MKLLILAALTCVVATLARPDGTYTTKWDNVNIDEILGSERLLNAYTACLRGEGRCTPDGKDLKETLPDALENECSKCSEKQKGSADKVITFLVNKRPDLWEKLGKIYDPDNIYQERYKDKIEAVKGKQ